MTAARTEERAEAVATPPPTRAAAPLVAVCGLCGGAGASTLALLAARHATERSERPVLLADVGGPGGGLSLYAGLEAPRSLAGAANLIGAGEPPAGGIFAEGDGGLRLLSGGPELDADADREALARLLRDARQAHALTVVDCGTLRTAPEREVLAAASHVAWVVPATLSGARRGRRTLELFGIDRERREMLVARHDGAGRTAPAEELTALAAGRGAPLILMPDVPDLGEEAGEPARDAAAITLDAIWSSIRR